jgi:hypothetical protein
MTHERDEPGVEVAERRQHVRYPEHNRVHFRRVGVSGRAHAGAPHEGRLHDLSEGGLCLIASKEFSAGTHLCLAIFFEHSPNDPLMVLGEVRHCRPEDDGFAMGLKFVPGTDEQREALEAIRAYLVERYGG